MYGQCEICGAIYGYVHEKNFEPCEHIKEKVRVLKYKRKLPEKGHNRIVTKKAKFFGKLMYEVLVAGGAPEFFTPAELRNRTIEGLLDSIMPNGINFKVSKEK